MRQEFSAKTKLAAWQRSNGHCEHCTRKLYPGDTHYDHINPDGLTGEPTLTNCAVLCRSCHRIKTVERDIPAIAKAKRRERKQAGIRKKSRMPGSRDSKWKIKVGGGVVLR